MLRAYWCRQIFLEVGAIFPRKRASHVTKLYFQGSMIYTFQFVAFNAGVCSIQLSFGQNLIL